MARPPRGRLPGTGRTSDETGDSELPLELPRVDPIRPRAQRASRVEPKLDQKSDAQSEEKGPARFMPPLRPAAPEPDLPPQRLKHERVENPFDYYAMPNNESDPLSRPIVKPTVTEKAATEKPEFLTSKYYTPRSDLTARREFDDGDDQTANWARSVRPGRPILDGTFSRDDDTPLHLRNLPSRVRDHLRTEPKMPQVSETLGSFVQSAPTTTQLRARSGVPLPLAPELRAPVPQDVRVTRQVPDLPMPSFEDGQNYEDRRNDDVQIPQDLEAQIADAFHDNARDDFAHEPDFDSASDEAVTHYDRDVPPLLDDLSEADLARHALPDADSLSALDGRDAGNSAPVTKPDMMPSWMRRTEQVAPPPPVAVSDWDQDQALHALTSRIRTRSVEMANRMNGVSGESVMKKARDTFGFLRSKARDIQESRQQARSQKQADKVAREEDMQQQAAAPVSHDLRASRTDDYDDGIPDFMIRTPVADQSDVAEPRRRWSFFTARPRAPVVRVSAEANRAVRRKRQSRLYEDIVAWIVVPPFIIGMIYGGLELAKFLSNSPLGKLLSGE